MQTNYFFMPQSHLLKTYQPGFGLLLDLYHLTMAYGFWKSGHYRRKAVFNLFYRKNPFEGTRYTIAAGLQLAIDLLESFQYSAGDIQYLGQLKGADGKPLFDISFLNYLQRMRLSCDIDAIPEGTVVMPHQPLIRVEGPLIQAQIIESALINVVNFSSLIATKAARMVQAAGREEVIEFGLRRAQGIDGALTAARSAYLGGCHGTSNVMAGRLYDIPVKGTHAHSWIMVFEDELEAFREYAKAMPNNCIFLVDTYDTIEGVRNAIRVGRELRREGHEMVGIRLDSGDLSALSIEARRLLDDAGFEEAIILVSDQIDEYQIGAMHRRGSRVDAWGIGTRLVTSSEKPALGGVYKLAAIEESDGGWGYRIKVSEEAIKISNPGIQQVRRIKDEQGIPVADLIYDIHLPFTPEVYDERGQAAGSYEGLAGEDLLVPVFRRGQLVYQPPSLQEIRRHSLEQQALFQRVDWKRFQAGLEKHLYQKKKELIERHRQALTPKN